MRTLLALCGCILFSEMILIGLPAYAQLYDYVIVGGGTAGLLLATRLSENSKNKILVLEAGDAPVATVNVPLAAPMFQGGMYDWQYKSVPQNNSFFGMKEKRACLPKGKVLGGSSTINYLVYSRGSKADYDNWEKEGCQGWSGEEVLPYFLKSENNSNFRGDYFHGTEGEMNVQKTNYYTDLAEAYLNAAKELNYTEGDFNGADEERFMILQGFINNGQRWSTYRAFYDTLKSRKNVVILTEARATKILFDEKEANGVEYRHNNYTEMAYVTKEVLLCAGAISTPQLLMLSGIGPREDLEKLGVPVISDLPVGKNYQDHVSTGIPFIVDPPYTLEFSRTTSIEETYRFAFGKGPLTSMGFETAGFINSKYNKEPKWPDLELLFLSYTASSDEGKKSKDNLCITEQVWKEMFLPYIENETFSCVPVVIKPKSRGEIKLASTNPTEEPLINPNYFAAKEDLEVLVEGIKACYKFSETKTMKTTPTGYLKVPLNTRPFPSKMPGCENFTNIDEYYACWAKVFTLPVHHSCCTCKMGNVSDPSTVVDSELRVKGIKSLRVVDASIMPYIPTGHTEAPTLMIAEKAADMILSSSVEGSRLVEMARELAETFFKLVELSLNS